jgi:hypothetical protein
MTIAGRMSLDATVFPKRLSGRLVWAATQADAEQFLALLEKPFPTPEALASHSRPSIPGRELLDQGETVPQMSSDQT